MNLQQNKEHDLSKIEAKTRWHSNSLPSAQQIGRLHIDHPQCNNHISMFSMILFHLTNNIVKSQQRHFVSLLKSNNQNYDITNKTMFDHKIKKHQLYFQNKQHIFTILQNQLNQIEEQQTQKSFITQDSSFIISNSQYQARLINRILNQKINRYRSLLLSKLANIKQEYKKQKLIHKKEQILNFLNDNETKPFDIQEQIQLIDSSIHILDNQPIFNVSFCEQQNQDYQTQPIIQPRDVESIITITLPQELKQPEQIKEEQVLIQTPEKLVERKVLSNISELSENYTIVQSITLSEKQNMSSSIDMRRSRNFLSPHRNLEVEQTKEQKNRLLQLDTIQNLNYSRKSRGYLLNAVELHDENPSALNRKCKTFNPYSPQKSVSLQHPKQKQKQIFLKEILVIITIGIFLFFIFQYKSNNNKDSI